MAPALVTAAATDAATASSSCSFNSRGSKGCASFRLWLLHHSDALSSTHICLSVNLSSSTISSVPSAPADPGWYTGYSPPGAQGCISFG